MVRPYETVCYVGKKKNAGAVATVRRAIADWRAMLRAALWLIASLWVPPAIAGDAGPAGDTVPIDGLLLDARAARAAAADVRVVDGDTLAIGAVRIRLIGIDAPEAGDPGEAEAFGAMSLSLRLSSGILCLTAESDRWGRAVARCWLKPEMLDLSALMVRHGYALSDARFSPGYPVEEAAARAAGAGLWACGVEAPPSWAVRKACR